MGLGKFKKKMMEIGIGLNLSEGIEVCWTIKTMSGHLEELFDVYGNLYVKNPVLYGKFLGIDQKNQKVIELFQNVIKINYIDMDVNGELLIHGDLSVLKENIEKDQIKSGEIGSMVIEGYGLKKLFTSDMAEELKNKIGHEMIEMHDDAIIDKIKKYIQEAYPVLIEWEDENGYSTV